MGVIGGAITLVFLLSGLVVPLIAPVKFSEVHLEQRLRPPAWEAKGTPEHILGTDGLGRDILTRIIYGARVSFLVGVSAVVVAGLIGLPLGILAGYYGGFVDIVIQRLIEIQMGFPFILLAIILTVIFPPGLGSVVLVLGISSWVQYGRLARVETLATKQAEFITAARLIGCTNLRVLLRHVFPNLVPTLIVILTTQLSRAILAEATLSFLGMGVSPPTPSWGGMISDGRAYTWTAGWIQTFPGIAIVLCVSGIGLLGNWLRDRLDPKLQF